MSVIKDASPRAALKQSWKIQRRVTMALFLREIMTRFGRHNIGFLWLFVEPMMFTLAVTALWTATGSIHGSTLPIAAFAVTGYSSVLLWRNMPARTINSIEPNLSLMYHRNVKVFDIFIARLLLEFSGATISFIVLCIFFISIGWIEPPEDVLKVCFAWFLLSWFGFSLAILLGALAEMSEMVDKLWHPASYILFPLSGAAYLVSALPPEAQNFVLYLPMVHGVEFLRDGFFGTEINAIYDIEYMSVCCAVMTLLGLALTRKISREVIPE